MKHCYSNGMPISKWFEYISIIPNNLFCYSIAYSWSYIIQINKRLMIIILFSIANYYYIHYNSIEVKLLWKNANNKDHQSGCALFNPCLRGRHHIILQMINCLPSWRKLSSSKQLSVSMPVKNRNCNVSIDE